MAALTLKDFYKVIVMKVDVFESEIVDERHFSSSTEAAHFCDDVLNNSDNMTFMVKM